MNFLPLSSIISKYSLIMVLSQMGIKVKYNSTKLGLIWTALEPLLFFSLLYVVFTNIRENDSNFAIYLIIGVMFIHLFSRGTMNGLMSLQSNTPILKSINIAKEIFPAVTTCITSIFMFVELGVLFSLAIFFNFIPSWTIVFLPFLMILFLLLVLGVTYFLSVLFVYFRDLQYIWSVFSSALLFLSPVFWYLDETEGILLTIHKINPLGQIIELGHKIFFGEIIYLSEWLYTSSLVFLILFSGYALFRKYEKNIVEKM